MKDIKKLIDKYFVKLTNNLTLIAFQILSLNFQKYFMETLFKRVET